ncbi:hypothetical protein HPB51_020112 [Rhipicephalus microplus]|uniref:Uncharacterized protein n=1 Tax=Rhipicephalus microplus TaxID=6941 RepID=A0A9J6EIK9_RHIMP|nr:hypothetical protein HPB51_020112 [Rhipicephalus microplus]
MVEALVLEWAVLLVVGEVVMAVVAVDLVVLGQVVQKLVALGLELVVVVEVAVQLEAEVMEVLVLALVVVVEADGKTEGQDEEEVLVVPVALEVWEMGKVGLVLVAMEIVVVLLALLVQVQDIKQLQELEVKVQGEVYLLLVDTRLRLVVALDVGVLPHNQVLQGIQHHRTQGVTQMELELELVVDLGLAVGLVVVLVQRLVLESGLLGEVGGLDMVSVLVEQGQVADQVEVVVVDAVQGVMVLVLEAWAKEERGRLEASDLEMAVAAGRVGGIWVVVGALELAEGPEKWEEEVLV